MPSLAGGHNEAASSTSIPDMLSSLMFDGNGEFINMVFIVLSPDRPIPSGASRLRESSEPIASYATATNQGWHTEHGYRNLLLR